MPDVDVVFFHREPRPADPPLTALLQAARGRVVAHHADLFRRAGAARILVVGDRAATLPALGTGEGSRRGAVEPDTASFGAALAAVVAEERIRRLVLLGGGSVPLLRGSDARRLVEVAAGPGLRAATNNRYSSDVCAVSSATELSRLPDLPGDNALPRWLEERAGFAVEELRGRERLALDVDGPLDLLLLGLVRRLPPELRDAVGSLRDAPAAVPVAARIEAIRGVAADPRAELLVFGRASARGFAWLERRLPCRVRFLAEERGLRASTPLALGAAGTGRPRPPRATLGRLLAREGPGALARVVGELADGAILDTRVLLADHLGAEEQRWPAAEDRYASDLLAPAAVADPWLRDLTASAADAPIPILLGGHSLVGPGLPLVLGGTPGGGSAVRLR